MKLLLDYGWPGNVRELSNLVDRYTALYAQQEVDLYTVPRSMVPSGIKKLMELPETPNRLLEQNATTMLTSREPNDFDNPIFGVPSAKVKDVCDIKLDTSIDDVQRVINLAQGGADFPDEGVELKQHLLEIERGLIRQALTKAEGNVSKTARLLKVQRTTLIEKINKYGMH